MHPCDCIGVDTAAPFGTKTLAEAVKLKLARVLLFPGVVGLLEEVAVVLAVIAGLFVALFDDPAADDGRRMGMAREAILANAVSLLEGCSYALMMSSILRRCNRCSKLDQSQG